MAEKGGIAGWGLKAEFAIVTCFAFGVFVLDNFYQLLFAYGAPTITTSGLNELIMYELVTLLVLNRFLRKRNWDLKRLSAAVSVGDIPIGLGLAGLSYLISFAAWVLLSVAAPSIATSVPDIVTGGQPLELATVLAVSVVNPIFEETFVCAYVVTALSPKLGTTTAVNMSVGIRLLYHLYQGPLAVVGIIPLGLLLAWYYARTRRLLPLIVAHAILDLIGLIEYV